MAKSIYPTAHQIEDMFQWRESPETMDKFDAVVAPNVDAKGMGHDHHLAGEHRGADSWKEANKERIVGMLDMSKGIKLDIVNVVGGGDSPWACVEMKTVAKTKAGKKWNHEFVYVVRFNLDGKISKIRAYYDSAHTQDHVENGSKAQNGY